MPTPRIKELLSEVTNYMRLGKYLSAFDRAQSALRLASNLSREQEQQLQYYTVLALARVGANEQARSRYDLFNLKAVDQVDFAALGARLVKDQALASSSKAKQELFSVAAKRYQEIYDKTGRTEHYPGVNAATTYRLAGEIVRSKELAEDVLRLCAESDDDYWCYASQAEAYLLLDDSKGAIASLAKAGPLANGDLSAIAATRKQLALISDSGEVLNALALPRIIHFAGHIISGKNKDGRFPAHLESDISSQIKIMLADLNVGIGYGSLASGADILFAEAILERGGELHVVLPFSVDDFKKVSVAPAGAAWLERFDRCWESAASTSFGSDGGYHGDDSLFHYCSLFAMGRARLRHQSLGAPISQVLVWDGQETVSAAGTYGDRMAWIELGHESLVIPIPAKQSQAPENLVSKAPDHSQEAGKKLHAILFGDIKGFSDLPDVQVPVFVREVMGCIATVIDGMHVDGQENQVLMANTWGDGLFVVLKDVEYAAKCSILMQNALKNLYLERPHDSGRAELRLGAHFGPIYEILDPVTKRTNFFGEHVNRAARIEPITPSGEVYVTESFAAQLALAKDLKFKTEYVGYMPMAKNYGDLRMYLLRELAPF